MNESAYCVLWSRDANRLEFVPLETAVNLGMNAFLDDRPGRVILRTDLTEQQARTFIKANAALMARRSLARIEAEDGDGSTTA